MEKEKIILIGGGGHCSSVIDVIEQQNIYHITGIIDVKEKVGKLKLKNYKIIASDDDLFELTKKNKNFLITIGQIHSPAQRIDLFDCLKKYGVILPTIISPIAYVSPYSKIKEGSIIMHFAQVNVSAKIGKNCIINSKALIEHGAKVGDHCHIATGAIVNGDAIIGKGSFIGSGAVVIQGAKVPDFSFVKANSIFRQVQHFEK